MGKVAQKAVIVRNEEVLLVRDPRSLDIWELPGGRLNAEEEPPQGLVREIYEELGVMVEVKRPLWVEQFVQGNEGKLALMIAYEAVLPEGEELKPDPSEVAEVRFVPLAEALNLKLFPEYRRVLSNL